MYRIALIALLAASTWLYQWKNGHFRTSKLLSPLPSVHAPVPTTQIDPLLNQTFRFLGKGGTCFAFLGEDGHTVLKLFKQQHSLLFSTPFPGACDHLRIQHLLTNLKKHSHKQRPFLFNSCRLAHDTLKEETGLIYLCLQPNTHFARPIKLIDAWGIPHHIDLSRTEFALQHKGKLLFPHLSALLHAGQREEIKQTIDALLTTIKQRCHKGIGDRDPNLLINFGYLKGQVIAFDLGSYFPNPALTHPPQMARELYLTSYALQKWLEKHCPDLLDYLLDSIAKVAT